MVSTRRDRRATATATTTANTTATTTANTPELRRAQINATNNAELRRNARNILETIQTFRPKNTTRTYDPKQREFQVRDISALTLYTTCCTLRIWPGIL